MHVQLVHKGNNIKHKSNTSIYYLVDISLLDPCLLGTRTGRVEKITVSLYYTWSF